MFSEGWSVKSLMARVAPMRQKGTGKEETDAPKNIERRASLALGGFLG